MTTVHNSSVNAAAHAKKPEKTGRYGSHGSAADGLETAFGDMFTAMVEGTGRQDLAATAAADGKPSPAGLAAEVLGPSVHIITTEAPATSDESLKAFARAQGMDEEALALIFDQGLAAAQAALTGENLTDGELPLALPATATGATTPGLGLTGNAEATPTTAALMAANAAALAGRGPGQQADNPSTAAGGLLSLGPEASLRWTLGEAQPATAKEAPQVLFGLNGVRPLVPTASQQAAATEEATHPESANQSLAASLILGAAEASQFARRLQLKQMAMKGEKADKAEPRLATAAGGALAGPEVSGAELPVEALVLEPGLGDADVAQLWQHRQSDNRPGHGQPQGSGGSSPTAERSQVDVRAEQYERLSERLADALGQRLAAQIAKGNWKVEMALHPSELGNIDVELNMKQGQLEASFSASQPVTQSLIADGLPRLKEMLAQMGMEVASMHVNVRQQGQHGGNPTPRREPSGVAGVSSKRDADGTSDMGTLTPTRSRGITNDGLDVLA